MDINKNYTIVSGLWNINRNDRNFEDHYIPRFKEFLQIDANLILFLPKNLEHIVWEVRDRKNTFVKIFELEDLKNLYAPHWDKTQELRTDPDWINITGENGWLVNSPQATSQWYNPMQHSKIFMLHDSTIYNPFNTDYFYWMDGGLTNTVPTSHLVDNSCMDYIVNHTDRFLFLCYPYAANDEIHGFKYDAMNKFAGAKVKHVCRGGLFGGRKEQISETNAVYYKLLEDTLNAGYMGADECMYTILSYREPHIYRKFQLDGNGLVLKFTDALLKNDVTFLPVDTPKVEVKKYVSEKELEKIKTNLYILTFNFPDQLLYTIESMKEVPEWLEKPNLVLLDNSTDPIAQQDNKEIAEEYNFEYIWLEGNSGICGGRQKAAEHFHNSDADFYFFFEDDMTSNPPKLEGQYCRNGFRKYIPNLYSILHKIMLKEDFDFLKMSFTEVYWDNDIQTSWYNVPQDIRTKFWPNYDQLPITGKDLNAPRTEFNKIHNVDGVAYIDGDVTYTNWPMIMSKKGNQKVFIDTTWAHPFEQTWMSHVFQKQKEGEIKSAVLLASPIWHERIKYYKPEERREN